jgi:hypothetical protein
VVPEAPLAKNRSLLALTGRRLGLALLDPFGVFVFWRGGLALRFADSVWLFLPPTVGLLGVSVRQVFTRPEDGLKLSPSR